MSDTMFVADSGLFPAILRYRAETTPGRLAIIVGEERISYAELDARVEVVAGKLAGLGVQAGHRVATLLRNSARVPEVVHALSRLGTVLVPLNIRLTPAELAWQLADSGVRLLLVDDQTGTQAVAAADQLRSDHGIQLVSIEGGSDGVAALADAPEAAVTPNAMASPDDLFAVVYTSGTTGRPKGAMISQGNIWWSAIGSALNLGTQLDDRWLACMPLFHVGGLSILTRSAIYGITAVIQERFDPIAVNQAIEAEHVTIVSVVSAMLRRMLDAHGSAEPYPDWLRCVLLGGGPAPKPLLEDSAKLGVPVVQTYGLTETCSQAATLGPEDALRKLGSAGKALFPNQLRIGRDDGTTAVPGEPGEILIQGPVVTRGYAGRPEATARSLAGGWLHTGDAGYLDDEGYLYVLDRRSDLIVSGGENVYPAEVEAALLAHPAIEEVGVIGLPDDEWGQIVVAVVRLSGDSSVPGTAMEEGLRAFCREQLAGYKVPRRIHFADTPLPRTAGGKLLRRELRAIEVNAG